MKSFWIALLALASACSHAAFDFQFQSRYNSSAVVETAFDKVVQANDELFVVGEVGGDILIAKFDRYGGMLDSQLWDSPLAHLEIALDVAVTDAGKVVVTVQSLNDRYVVQFNASLDVEWERNFNPSSPAMPFFHAAVDRVNGNVYVAYASPTDSQRMELVRIGPDGTNLASRSMNIANRPLVKAIRGIESSSAPGLMIAGRKSDQAYFGRFDANLATVYERTFAGTASSDNIVVDLYVNSSGVGTGVGSANNGGNKEAAIYAINGSGTITRFLRPEGYELNKLQFLSSSNYRAVLAKTLSSVEIVDFSRSNGSLTRRIVTPNAVRDFAELPGANKLFSDFEDDVWDVARYDLGSNSQEGQADLLNATVESFAPLSSDYVAAVGTDRSVYPTVGILGLLPAVGASADRYALVGYPDRGVAASGRGPDDSMSILAADPYGRATVMAYRNDGSLKFARVILGGGNISAAKMAMDPAGNHYIVGKVGRQALGFVKVSSTGAILASRTILNIDEEGFGVTVAPDGSVVVGGNGYDGAVMVRLSDMGIPLAFYTEGLANDGFTNLVQVHALADRVLVVTANTATGGQDRVRIYEILNSGVLVRAVNIVDGLYQNSTLDASGNLWVAATRPTSLEIRRYQGNATNIVLATRSIATAGEPQVGYVATTPTGQLVTSYLLGTTNKLVWTDSAGAGVYDVTIESTVDFPTALAVDPTGLVYYAGLETDGYSSNVYLAKYLSNGVRSAQRRLAGLYAFGLDANGSGVWVTGQVPTRKKGNGPYAARYSK